MKRPKRRPTHRDASPRSSRRTSAHFRQKTAKHAEYEAAPDHSSAFASFATFVFNPPRRHDPQPRPPRLGATALGLMAPRHHPQPAHQAPFRYTPISPIRPRPHFYPAPPRPLGHPPPRLFPLRERFPVRIAIPRLRPCQPPVRRARSDLFQRSERPPRHEPEHP